MRRFCAHRRMINLGELDECSRYKLSPPTIKKIADAFHVADQSRVGQGCSQSTDARIAQLQWEGTGLRERGKESNYYTIEHDDGGDMVTIHRVHEGQPQAELLNTITVQLPPAAASRCSRAL
jgi:hypothetical protein